MGTLSPEKEWQTATCENITFPQLHLRAPINDSSTIIYHICKIRLLLLLPSQSLPSFCYRVIDTAARQLTKTAITVTAIFIVALGYDLWFYLFAHLGLIEYKMNTPSQKIGKCWLLKNYNYYKLHVHLFHHEY